MEIKFETTTLPCLRKAACQVQNQEQTQEVRLSEAMPDIGRVLGSWGQVLIRGKQWHSNGMSVNGGVQAWVLYAPEDGSQIRSVETWIPFQMKWDFPETQRDGSICVMPLLKGMDARSTSARKLMVRANISVLGEALEPIEPEICCPGEIPPDVQLLKNSYPVQLPLEAGEKIIQMEEELDFPSNLPPMDKILHYTLTPMVTEQKVMAGRLVFRGNALLSVCYSSADGGIHTWEQELPFSQFTELDKDHSANASAWITVILTALELEKAQDEKMSLKATMAAQYVVYDRTMLDTVQDAYSPQRKVNVQMQELGLPILLDTCKQTLHISHSLPLEGEQVIAANWICEHPRCMQNEATAEITLPGQFQILYLDKNGNLQNATAKAEEKWEISSDSGNWVSPYVREMTDVQANFSGDALELRADATVEAAVFSRQGIPMVKELDLGEIQQPDSNRASLILRRADKESLWEIAKDCGSTVEEIKKANQILEQPEIGQMLLIPVI